MAALEQRYLGCFQPVLAVKSHSQQDLSSAIRLRIASLPAVLLMATLFFRSDSRRLENSIVS